MRTILTPLLIVALAIPLWAQQDAASIKREYRINAEKLKPFLDAPSPIEDQPSVPLLERKWQLSADWICVWLDAHPNATAEQLDHAFTTLDRDIESSTILLGTSTYLVAINTSEIGTVFVVTNEGSGSELTHRVRWTIREKSVDFESELAAWTSQNATNACRETNHSNCGPLFARPVGLPDTADGHARFYLDATYAQFAGATVGKQLSMWEWDGRLPKPLILKKYAVMIEQSNGTELKGKVLHVGEKEFFRSFDSCGSCEERQIDWSIRITPNAFEDLGEKSLVPELDALNEVVFRLARGESAANLASDEVIEVLKQIIGDSKAEIATWSEDRDYFSLGMISQSTVTHENGETFLCFATDEVGPLRFRMQRRNDTYFLRDVQDLTGLQGANSCSVEKTPEQ